MLLIEMYGDSTTWGQELVNGEWVQSASNVPSVLQSKYPTGVTVVNCGIGGLTMPQMVQGAAPATKAWDATMRDSHANVVTLNFGINDASQTWEDDTNIVYYINQLISIAQAHGKAVVVETSNPINTPQYNRLSQVSYLIRTVSHQRSLVLADHHAWIQTGIPNWTTLLPDGVHPNAALYNYKADNLYAIMNPLVQSMLANGA